MIPDDVEKIIMTKEDYDRNVEQLLLDKCKAELEVERLNNIIKKLEEFIEREVKHKEEDTKLEHNTFITINSTLKSVLERFKELKGE